MAYPCKFYKDGKEISLNEVKKYIFDNYDKIKSELGVPPIEPPKQEGIGGELPNKGVQFTNAEMSNVFESIKRAIDERVPQKEQEATLRAFADLYEKYGIVDNKLSAEKLVKEINDRRARGEKFNISDDDVLVLNYLNNEYISEAKDYASVLADTNSSIEEKQAALFNLNMLDTKALEMYNARNASGLGRALRWMQSIVTEAPEVLREVKKQEWLGGKADFANDKDRQEFNNAWNEERRLLEEQHKLRLEEQKAKFDQVLEEKQAEIAKLKISSEDANKLRKENRRGKVADFKKKMDALKIKKSDTYLLPIPPNIINGAIDIIVKGYEAGLHTIDMIDNAIKYIKENYKGEFGEKEQKEFADEWTEKLEKNIDKKAEKVKRDKDTILNDIKSNATENNVSTLTKDMLKDFNALVDEHLLNEPLDKVYDSVYKELKEILPNIEKQDMVDAINREGIFKPETKESVNKELEQHRRDFKTLTNLNDKLKNLQEKYDLVSTSLNDKRIIANEIQKTKDAINKELIAQGNKISNLSKENQAEYVKLAQAHNKLIDGVNETVDFYKDKLGDNYDLVKQAVDTLKILGASDNSKLDYKSKIEDARRKVEKIKSRLNGLIKDKEALREISNQLDNGLDDIAKLTKDLNLKISIENRLKALKSQQTKKERLIASGNFEKQPVLKAKAKLPQTEALTENQRKLNEIDSLYKAKVHKEERIKMNTAKFFAETLISIIKNLAIGGYYGAVKVATAMVNRPMRKVLTSVYANTMLKKVNAFADYYKAIFSAAEGGGEFDYLKRQALKQMASFKTLEEAQDFGQTMMDSLTEKINKNKEKIDKLENNNGKKKKIDKLKQANNLYLAQIIGVNSWYNYIETNFLKAAAEKYIGGTSLIEKEIGKYQGDQPLRFKDFDYEGTKTQKTLKIADAATKVLLDHINYTIGFIGGRLHGGLKNPDQRFFFLTSFMGKIHKYIQEHPNATIEELSDTNLLKGFSAESYFDAYKRGSLQQERITTALDARYQQELKESPDIHGKFKGYALSALTKVAKIPTNMAYEYIGDALSGSIWGRYKIIRETQKLKGEAKARDLSKAEIKDYIVEGLKKMPPDKAAKIARALKTGDVAMGLMALMVYGAYLKYGGEKSKTSSKDDRKKKEGELKAGQISFGDNEAINKTFSVAAEHFDILRPTLLVLEMKDVAAKAEEKGESKGVAMAEKVMDNILEQLPDYKVLHLKELVQQDIKSDIKIPSRLGKSYTEPFKTNKELDKEKDDKIINDYIEKYTEEQDKPRNTTFYGSKDKKYISKIDQYAREDFKNQVDKYEQQNTAVTIDGKSVNYNSLTFDQKKKVLSKELSRATKDAKNKLKSELGESEIEKLKSENKKEKILLPSKNN